jgi:hypothetical protein
VSNDTNVTRSVCKAGLIVGFIAGLLIAGICLLVPDPPPGAEIPLVWIRALDVKMFLAAHMMIVGGTLAVWIVAFGVGGVASLGGKDGK